MSPAATATGASYGRSSVGGAGTAPIISFTMSIVERLVWSAAAMSSLSANFTDPGSSASAASLAYVVDVVAVGAVDLCAFFFFYSFEMRKITHTAETKSTHHYFIENNSIKSTWMDRQEGRAREMMNQLYPFRPFRLRSFQVARSRREKERRRNKTNNGLMRVGRWNRKRRG